jgi:hypothetical protein
MWQRIDIYKHVRLRPSLSADLLKLREKEEQSFTTTNIVRSGIAKPFLTLYLCQHICLTQLGILADTLWGATTGFDHYQKPRCYLS